jgi:hypothetical protein
MDLRDDVPQIGKPDRHQRSPEMRLKRLSYDMRADLMGTGPLTSEDQRFGGDHYIAFLEQDLGLLDDRLFAGSQRRRHCRFPSAALSVAAPDSTLGIWNDWGDSLKPSTMLSLGTAGSAMSCDIFEASSSREASQSRRRIVTTGGVRLF